MYRATYVDVHGYCCGSISTTLYIQTHIYFKSVEHSELSLSVSVFKL